MNKNEKETSLSRANQVIHELRQENASLKAENTMLKSTVEQETKARYWAYKRLSKVDVV